MMKNLISLFIILCSFHLAANTCVTLDEEKDNLPTEEIKAAKAVFETTLQEEGKTVVKENCSEQFTFYHIKLGSTITVVVIKDGKTKKMVIRSINSLGGAYSQLIKEHISGNKYSKVNRENVVDSQLSRRRIRGELVVYGKLGYGALFGHGFSSGPSFGFGLRKELNQFAVDFSVLNFTLGQHGDIGNTAEFLKLQGLYFLNPVENSSFYFGGGVSWSARFDVQTDNAEIGRQGIGISLSAGYEVLRASTIRLFFQLDAHAPIYMTNGTRYVNNQEEEVSKYIPSVTFSMGVGF